MNIQVIKADYSNAKHARAIVELLNNYACDEMGGGEPLSQYVKDNLVNELAKVPGAFTLLAYLGDTPIGIINCLMGFSTFACKPLVNIHDVAVNPDYRGHGVSQHLLRTVEDIARERGCCKITMEVLSGNEVAKRAYAKFGFSGYQLDASTGEAMFWQKKLS